MKKCLRTARVERNSKNKAIIPVENAKNIEKKNVQGNRKETELFACAPISSIIE